MGKGTLIRHAIENDRIFSMILWGTPGCGKTTYTPDRGYGKIIKQRLDKWRSLEYTRKKESEE